MPVALCVPETLDKAVPNACGNIRLFLPLSKKIVPDYVEVRFVKLEDLPYYTADVVVTQRAAVNTPEETDKLLAYCQATATGSTSFISNSKCAEARNERIFYTYRLRRDRRRRRPIQRFEALFGILFGFAAPAKMPSPNGEAPANLTHLRQILLCKHSFFCDVIEHSGDGIQTGLKRSPHRNHLVLKHLRFGVIERIDRMQEQHAVPRLALHRDRFS